MAATPFFCYLYIVKKTNSSLESIVHCGLHIDDLRNVRRHSDEIVGGIYIRQAPILSSYISVYQLYPLGIFF